MDRLVSSSSALEGGKSGKQEFSRELGLGLEGGGRFSSFGSSVKDT